MENLGKAPSGKVMAGFCACILFMLTALPAIGGAPTPKEIWTVREAVAFALQNSPDSRIALQRINAAAAVVEQADSAFYPRINLIAAYDQTNNPMYSFGNILNQGSFSNDIDFNNPGRTDNLNMKAELLYRFYNGGRNQAGRKAAESGYEATEMDRKTTLHRLGFEVVQAYQKIVQAADQVRARTAELKAIEASLAVASARYEAGDLLKADLLNFEVQKSRASENLIISKHHLELAQKVFLNLLGLDQGSAKVQPGVGSEQSVPEKSHYRQRPEIESLRMQLDGAEAQLRKTEGGKYPTLDGYASYQYDHGWVTDGSGDSWAAGIRLNYNLYDGKQNSGEIAAQKADYQRLKQEVEKLNLAINLEIQQAELNYNQALERRQVTDKMVEVAQESAQLSRERFKEGVILSSDLIDVEVRLTDALVRQSAAKANYQIAIANLRRAAGLQQFSNTTEELLETQP